MNKKFLSLLFFITLFANLQVFNTKAAGLKDIPKFVVKKPLYSGLLACAVIQDAINIYSAITKGNGKVPVISILTQLYLLSSSATNKTDTDIPGTIAYLIGIGLDSRNFYV